ncbi:MAG: hypothetical protein PHV53_01560 [Fermentimonas sp.]|nr:hypothetical protein [Fermentimonas sp.]
MLLFINLFFSLTHISAQEPISNDTLLHRLWKQTQLYPQEKVYAGTDRSVYVAGDTVRFRVQVVNFISHQPEGFSRYAYTELFKGDSLVQRVKVRGDSSGVIAGYIPLDKYLDQGIYQLRAYTRYSAFQKNPSVFTRQLLVLSHYDLNQSDLNFTESNYNSGYKSNEEIHDFRVSIYPEGGQSVEGALSRFTFEAVGSTGYGEEVSGYIVNSRNDTILQFNTIHDGMGEFSFIPLQGEEYQAICVNKYGREKVVNLPTAVGGSFALRVDANNEVFKVSLINNSIPADAADRFQLLVVQRGFPLYAKSWNGDAVIFPKNAFREGVLHFLLLDKGSILSERPVFVFKEEVSIELIKHNSSRMEVELRDKNGKQLNGAFSTFFTGVDELFADTNNTIQTELLLTTDLNGKIRNPGWYFHKSGSPEVIEAIDLLVQIHGSRRYNIESAIQGEYDEPEVLPEVTMQVSGSVQNRKGKGLQDCIVTLAAPGEGLIEQTVTSTEGRFTFTGLDVPENTRLIVSARTVKGKENINIILDEDSLWFEDVPFPNTTNTGLFISNFEAGQLIDYRNKTLKRLADDEAIRHIFLEEIEVSAPGKTYRTEYEQQASKVIVEDRIEQSGLQDLRTILRALGGVIWINKKDDRSGSGLWDPVLVLDGTPVYDIESIDYLINYLPVETIGQIDIIKGAHAVGYFDGKQNMIIAVSTKRGGYRTINYEKTNTGYLTPMGYQIPIDYDPPSDTAVNVVIEGVTLEGETFRCHSSVAN